MKRDLAFAVMLTMATSSLGCQTRSEHAGSATLETGPNAGRSGMRYVCKKTPESQHSNQFDDYIIHIFDEPRHASMKAIGGVVIAQDVEFREDMLGGETIEIGFDYIDQDQCRNTYLFELEANALKARDHMVCPGGFDNPAYEMTLNCTHDWQQHLPHITNDTVR